MNTRVLVAYHSAEGQTERIATRIADQLRKEGLAVDLADADTDPSPSEYQGIVVGDSIHAGRHSRQLVEFLEEHAAELGDRPVALFQVSLTSANPDEEHAATAHGMMQQLLDETGLDPDMVGLFAGALRYTQYGWLKKRLMSRIAKSEGGDHDTSRDYEYTDWNDVDAFARDAAVLFAVAPA